MSYIQIREKGLKFNQESIEIFWRRLELEDSTDAGDKYACFYAGLFVNAKMKGAPAPTFEETCDWVDTLTNEEKKSAMDCMGETTKYKEHLEKINDLVRKAVETAEGDKKKELEPTLTPTGSESTSSSLVS